MGPNDAKWSRYLTKARPAYPARYEQRPRHGEERVFALGYIGNRLHAVAYVERGEVTRIISLRKAKRKEENRYAAP